MSNNQEEKTVHQIWLELGISYANFEFSCGGDSMNDTTLTLIGKDGEQIDNQEIEDYIEDEIYNRVEFYVNSDGHYLGESGIVEITLDEDEEKFTYSKSSTSEWEERFTSTFSIKLDEKTRRFVEEKVLNINGDDYEFVLNYKKDCILTDEDEKILEALEEKVRDGLNGFEPDTQDDVQEYYTFLTNEEDEDIKFDDEGMLVTINNSVIEYREE